MPSQQQDPGTVFSQEWRWPDSEVGLLCPWPPLAHAESLLRPECRLVGVLVGERVEMEGDTSVPCRMLHFKSLEEGPYPVMAPKPSSAGRAGEQDPVPVYVTCTLLRVGASPWPGGTHGREKLGRCGHAPSSRSPALPQPRRPLLPRGPLTTSHQSSPAPGS